MHIIYECKHSPQSPSTIFLPISYKIPTNFALMSLKKFKDGKKIFRHSRLLVSLTRNFVFEIALPYENSRFVAHLPSLMPFFCHSCCILCFFSYLRSCTKLRDRWSLWGVQFFSGKMALVFTIWFFHWLTN